MGEKQKPWYPPGEGWIEWHGGANPVLGVGVYWMLRHQRRKHVAPPAEERLSDELLWDHDGGGYDIVAYRVVTPAPSTIDRALFDEMVEALGSIADMCPATQEITVASMMADLASSVLSKVREASK